MSPKRVLHVVTRFLTDMVSAAGGRPYNEDHCNFLHTASAACWVLADGLGGQAGGEMASQLACDTILQAFQKQPELSPVSLRSYVDAANQAILAHQQSDARNLRMASTVVVLASDFQSALWTHVGDSRLYHFRRGRILAQTKDHSVAQSLADSGDIKPSQIRFHPDRSSLRRSLGKLEKMQTTTFPKPVPVEPGDAFLLASDGFWEWVTEVEMEIELARARTPGDWLHGMEFRLLHAASPDHDNYSAVAVFGS